MQRVMRLLGGTLLVASIAVGAGMLALPIATGAAGFVPAVCTLLACFLYMTYCLFLVLEANLVAPEGSHLISMIRRTLGPWWRWVAWLSYLLLLYAALAAYITAGGGLLAQVLSQAAAYCWPALVGQVSAATGVVVLVSIAVLLVFCGTHVVDRCNRLLTLGLAVFFVLLVWRVVPHARVALLQHAEPHLVTSALPLILLSFTSHLIVPSLRVYFNDRPRDLLWVLLCGSLIPLSMYLVWEYTVLGILPVHGAHGLVRVMHSDHQVATMVSFFAHYLGDRGLVEVVTGFSFFALSTSFVACGLSLSHFIADGLTLSQYRGGRWIGLILTFLPPILFAWYDPHGFTVALSYAGVFVAILFCLLPAMMVWQSRYVLCEKRVFRCWGGRPVLCGVMVLALAVMVVQILSSFQLLPQA